MLVLNMYLLAVLRRCKPWFCSTLRMVRWENFSEPPERATMDYFNPVAMVNERTENNTSDDFGANVRASLNILPVKGLLAVPCWRAEPAPMLLVPKRSLSKPSLAISAYKWQSTYSPKSNANPGLGWEKKAEWNVGIESAEALPLDEPLAVDAYGGVEPADFVLLVLELLVGELHQLVGVVGQGQRGGPARVRPSSRAPPAWGRTRRPTSTSLSSDVSCTITTTAT